MRTGLFLFLFIGTISSVFAQKYYYVENISITGNKKTQSDIIIRELGFNVGDSIAINNFTNLLERGRLNVFNTNLFLSVLLTNTIDSLNVNVELVVKERWYLLALPILYLADRNFNEWWYDRDRDLTRITYGINVKHFNLSGNNDQLRFKAYGGFVPYFELSYTRPYIDKRKRIGVSGGVYYSTQRSLPIRTNNDKLSFLSSNNRLRERQGLFAEVSLRNALYHFHSLYFGFSKTTIADTVAILNPNYFGAKNTHQNLFAITYDYRFDKRDNKQYALKGDFFYGQLSYTTIKSNEFSNQTVLYGFYSKYLSLGKKFYLEQNFRGKVSNPKLQFYSLTRGLGYGNNLVRGYELYVIDGQHYFVSKTSLKYRLIKKTINLNRYIKLSQFNSLPIAIYPNIFIDFGAVKNYFPELSSSNLSNKTLVGYGLGLDFVTWYDTTVKTYYSWNNINESRFFLGIVKDF